MSQQFDNTNRFVLFFNEQKKSERGPDYSGTLNVDGVEFFIDAWQKEGRNGVFFSGSVKLKEKQGQQRAPQQPQRQAPRQPQTHGQMRQAARGGFNRADDLDDIPPF